MVPRLGHHGSGLHQQLQLVIGIVCSCVRDIIEHVATVQVVPEVTQKFTRAIAEYRRSCLVAMCQHRINIRISSFMFHYSASGQAGHIQLQMQQHQ